MPRFTFNLQGVLRQRKLVEEQRQRELAEVQRAYFAMETELKEMDDEVRATAEDLRQNHLIGRISVDYLAAHRRFTLAMQRKALEHAARMAEVRKKVDAARAALVEAARQRKILDKLRERRQTDWQTDQDRRELSAADEVAQQIGVQLTRAQARENDRVPKSSNDQMDRSADSLEVKYE